MWRWGKTRCARCRHPLDPSSTSPCANCRLPRKKLKKSKGFGKTNCAKCGEGLNRRGVCTTCTKVPPYTKIRRLSYDSSHIAPKNVNPLERDIVNARVFVTIAAPTDLTKSNAQAGTARMESLALIECCSNAAMLVSASLQLSQERDGDSPF